MVRTSFSFVSLLLVLSCFAVLLGLSLGAANLSLAEVITALFSSSSNGMTEQIVWQLRMPRTLLAFIAGAGLAVSGMVLQTVTRNPLADPYLFGVSSGASFAVVVAIVIFDLSFYSHHTTLTYSSLSLAAFVGSLSVIAILLFVTRYQTDKHALVLAGVALSFLFSAFTSLLLYFSDPQAITAILFWTMGSFSRASPDNVGLAIGVLIAVLIVVHAYSHQLNAMMMGDETAVTVGVNPEKLRTVMLSITALMTATLVAICGGIGFVGLIIPHIVRYFHAQGANFHYLVCALFGGIFMVFVDILSRVVINNQELPIGIITAAIGSIFFLLLLTKNLKQQR